MSDQELIDYFEAFIKGKEKQLQETDSLKDSKAKNELINAVLKELEEKIPNEN